MVHEYEIVFIIRPDLDDADTLAAVERVEATVAETEGHLLERDDWGKRRLAYLVQKHAKGHYILLRILSSPTQILEIERKMRLDDRIIRFLTVKIADAVDIEPRLELAEEQRKIKAEEARRRAERAALEGPDDDENSDDDDDDVAANE
ncbi:MAG: 30S ribosomal protein S6 [Alphaproteobacteria bacterium]|nr:30S ribosomal protein S6 [Alphaproteobacteria bacterium]